MKAHTHFDVTRGEAFEDSLEELQARLAAKRATAGDLDTADTGDNYDLPVPDLLDDEFSATVIPLRHNEFTCARCFLVRHYSQRHQPDSNVCHECA